jgi:hypothetical protein
VFVFGGGGVPKHTLESGLCLRSCQDPQLGPGAKKDFVTFTTHGLCLCGDFEVDLPSSHP